MSARKRLTDVRTVEWGVPDPFAHKTYLHLADDPALPVQFSTGKRLRALQVQSFFKTLSEAAAAKNPAETAADTLHLAVLTAKDWRRLFSTPYGWGLARRSEGKVSLALPAAYPPRLIARWDAVRLRAGQQGVRAPGSVGAYLDTLLGLEWAHALLLTRQQGRALRPWLREVAAAHLYQAALVQLKDGQRLEYLSTWARLQQAGAAPEAQANGPETFAYPRAKQPFDALLRAQSALWLRAAQLGEAHHWTLTAADVQKFLQTEAKAAFTRPLTG